MFAKFYLFLFALCVLPLSAQIGGPSQVDVVFNLDFYRSTANNRSISIDFNNQSVVAGQAIPATGFEMSVFARPMKPGVLYPLTVSRGSDVRYGIGITAPDGYVAEINGDLKNSFYVPTITGDTITYQVALRSLAAAESRNPMEVGQTTGLRIGDIGWEVGLGKMSNGNAAGFIQIMANDLSPEIYTRTGVGVHVPSYNTSEMNLIYQDLNADGIKETIRQIRAPQCLVDFVDSSATEYQIRYYRSGTFNAATNLYDPVGSTLVTYTVSKSAATALTIIRTDTWGNITSTATSTVDGAVKDWELTVAGSGYVKKTTANNTATTSGRQEDVEIRYTSFPAGLPAAATKTYKLQRIFKNIATGANRQIGEKLVKHTYNPSQAGLERSENFSYWDDPSGSFYGLLKFREGAFGDWNLYSYEDIFYTGPGQTVIHNFIQWSKTNRINGAVSALIPRQRQLINEFTPDTDALNFDIATVTVSQIQADFNAGTVRLKDLELAYGYDDFDSKVTASREFLNLSGVRKNIGRFFGSPISFPLDYSSTGPNNNFIELDRTYNTPDMGSFNGSDDKAIRWNARYVPSAGATGFDKRLAFKPYMSVSPGEVKKAHGYASVGSYEGISNAWVEVDVDGTQAAEIIDNTTNRIIGVKSAATGNTFNADKTQAFFYEMAGRLLDPIFDTSSVRNTVYADARTRYVNPGNITHGGVTVRMDAVQLVAGKSTKAVRAFNAQGELAREERWAYDTGSQWRLIEIFIYGHDAFGRVNSITRQDGASSSQRITYEAFYDGLMLAWEIDVNGVRTDFTYDGLGRLAAKTVSSAHGLTSVPASIVSANKLDAMDRVVELSTGGLVESSSYDAMGLLLSKTDSNNLPTTFSYSRESGAGMRVDILHPNGGTETRIHHKNGRLKSVTGTAVVAKNYTYSWDHAGTGYSGNLITRVDEVLLSSDTTAHPWGKTSSDWMGRVNREEHPTAATQTFVRTAVYNSLNVRLDETIETDVSQNGTAVTQSLAKKKGYNSMGFPSLAGIDVDGGELANASTDRLARAETNFVMIAGNLHEESVTTTYPENASATGITVTSRSKINGLANNVLSEISVTDMRGNTSTRVATLSRSTATISAVTTHGDTTTESSTKVMGFPTSSTSRQGRTKSATYDGAGRSVLESTATGARSFSTKTEYESGKARIWKRTTGLASDGTGTGYPTTFGYDTAGRVSLITDANGGTSNLGYNLRDQLVKNWGTAVTPVFYEYDSNYATLLKQHTYPVLAASAPDFTNAAAPPAGSSVVQCVRNNASGLATQRTDGLGADPRVTDYTYDVRGQLRTIQTPSSTATTHSVATSRITITHQYFPKTGELANIDYSGGSTPAQAFTWHRSGEMKTVMEGGSFTRTFNHDHTGNGGNALRRLAEDLPSYYTTIPALAGNDSLHSANRITRGYTSTGINGRYAGSSSGVSAGGTSGLSASRSAMSLGWDAGLPASAGFEGASLGYGYELGSAMPNRRTVSQFEEKRTYAPDRDLLESLGTTGGNESRARFDFTHDNLGRRDDVRQSGSVFGIYGGSLLTDLGYDSRSRLTTSASHCGNSTTAPVLQGRTFGYDYDLADNRRTAIRADAPAGGTLFNWGVNSLNEITTRQTPQWSEVSGFAMLSRGIALLPPPGTTAVAPKRTKEFYHAYHTTPSGAMVRKASIELLHAYRSGGGPDAAHPPHDKDLLDRRTVDLLLRPPTETLKYDGRGNLVNDAWWTYTWDGADRMNSVESSAAAITAGFPKVKLTFKYDWLGRRYAKQSHPYSGSSFAANPDKVTLYWWDGWNLLREAKYNVTAYSGANPTAASFVTESRYHWGLDLSGTLGGAGGAGGLVGLATRDAGQAASAPLFPAYDGNGNVIALLNAAGAVQASYEYDPYGKILRVSGPAAAKNPLRFATQYYDEETKLYYHHERYYSPELGRFLGRDPIREAGGRNLHAYTANNPANAVDVLGRASFFYGGGGNASFSDVSSFTFTPRTSWVNTYGHGSGNFGGGFGNSYGGFGGFGGFSGGGLNPAMWAARVAEMQQAQVSQQLAEIQVDYNSTLAAINPTISNPIAAPSLQSATSAHSTYVTPAIDFSHDGSSQLWAATASASELNAAADAEADPARRSMFRDYSQARSEADHDGKIINGTIFGVTAIVQPEMAIVKGLAAVGLAVKGLSIADDIARVAKGGDDLVRLYHGATSNATSKIISAGFRQADTFFAEEMATSRYFAGEAAARTGARSTTSIEFTMPRSVAEDFGLMQRRLIGADRNLPTPDIDFGTGFERILPSGNVDSFNSLMESGIITTRRLQH